MNPASVRGDPGRVPAPPRDGLRSVEPSSARASVAPRLASRGRIDAIDWLRGLAVVLMIQTHLYDAWCNPAAKTTHSYAVTRYLGGIPFRLFLLLVGVSMAIKFESQIARRVERRAIVTAAVKRGVEIVALAYLFRLQEYVLGGGYDWRDLFRVDILNCIGASMVVAAFVAAPRNGRPRIALTLAAAAVFIALGPIIGPAHFPSVLPRPLTSYIGGERPMAWFPLFPSAAWTLVGVVVGHYWVRHSDTPRRQAIAFVITAVVGVAMIEAVAAIRRVDPYIIRYPSYMVQQMGPGTFFNRLGEIGPLALLAWVGTKLSARMGFSVMRQLGQTSLLVYWIHVELCYGRLFARLHHRLGMIGGTVGLVVMTAAMLGVSLLRTRYWRGWRRLLSGMSGRVGFPAGVRSDRR